MLIINHICMNSLVIGINSLYIRKIGNFPRCMLQILDYQLSVYLRDLFMVSLLFQVCFFFQQSYLSMFSFMFFFLTYYLCSPSNFTVSYFTGKYLIHFEITEMANRVSQHHLLNNMFPLHLFEVLSLSHTKFLHVFISGQSIFFH